MPALLHKIILMGDNPYVCSWIWRGLTLLSRRSALGFVAQVKGSALGFVTQV